MIRRIVVCLLITSLMLTVPLAQAQQPGKVHRIGYLSTGTPGPNFEAFRLGLRERGYIEGKNIVIETRFAEQNFDRLSDLAAELVSLKVDLIVAGNATVTRAAKKATSTIPIVMANAGDPVGTGLVASLARPGGNVTGLTNISPELLGKRLGLLKEVVPKASRLALLSDVDSRSTGSMLEDAQRTAKVLGVQFQLLEVKGPHPDIEGAFRIIVKERIGGLVTAPGPLIGLHRKRIVELLAKNRIPAIHTESQWADIGGLMSYGTNQADLYRRAAIYVDKILKGTMPTDLPVEQPMKFDFVINLKTAKQIGLTIPQSVLFRADRVIR